MSATIPVTLVVLTLDEEQHLAGCLDSAAGIEDVHVLDSGSTDRTVEVARQLGAEVSIHPFGGFGQQRNWAIDNIPARFDWQLHLDADERLTPALVAEIAVKVGADPELGGYLVPSKLMFAGRWLRHAGQYPAYQVRLFHRRRLRFVDHGHGQREQTTYPLGRLNEAYLHYAFSKGLDHWFAKHAVYARCEAEQALGVNQLADQTGGQAPSLFSRDSVLRRRAFKRLGDRLPCRYFLRLAYMMLLKRAFLDGVAGVTYAHMLATYESMIDVHLRLLRHGLKP